MRDLNPRPLAPEANALSTELIALNNYLSQTHNLSISSVVLRKFPEIKSLGIANLDKREEPPVVRVLAMKQNRGFWR